MRVFKQYHPKMIAKHVKGFFKGQLYIAGQGGFVFNKGRLVMPERASTLHRKTVQEVNQFIACFERQTC